jgi:hypothetical protein
VLRLHPRAHRARADIFDDISILPHLEGQAPNERHRLGPPRMFPQRSVVALAEHLHPQSSANRDAQPVRGTLSPTVKQAAPHQKRPAGWHPRGVEDGGAVPVGTSAKSRGRSPHDGPED